MALSTPSRHIGKGAGSPNQYPRQKQPRPAAPLLLRLLPVLLLLLAGLLLLTTVYLFHLHHAHHDPEGDASDLDRLQASGAGAKNGGNSPGGSALRHKMDLAHFLLQKRDREEAEKGQKEAMEMGGWRGGNEENFIKMVKEISHEDVHHEDTVPKHEVHSVAVRINQDGKVENEMIDGKVVDINRKTVDDAKSKEDPFLKLTWEQLQRALIDDNLLPHPIPPQHTARGFSGLPPDKSPALVGARRGQIHCPGTEPRVQAVMSSMLAFWNGPQGTRDRDAGLPHVEEHVFLPPPLAPSEVSNPKKFRRRYLTFEPDTGGWNNLRMSFENVVVLAAVSGRTLVLPPDQIVYLLEPKKGGKREKNYYDLVNITDNAELQRRVPIITSEEFLRLEGGDDGYVPLKQYNATYQSHLWSIASKCEERKKSDVFCEDLYDHFRLLGQLSPVSAEAPNENCFIFDADVFRHGEDHVSNLPPETRRRVNKFCKDRPPFYYNRTMHDAPVWHMETMDLRYRLLAHFYSVLLFTDPRVGNYYKRFVRDFMRYHDEVFCAAGKIVLALQYEDFLRRRELAGDASSPTSLDLDSELVGGYSSLHVRRGDLQFKEVKFDSLQWYKNTQEIWKPDEILYIATDENEGNFFDDFTALHGGPLRFFDDYKELAGLDGIDPTLYGMIDTVVASRGSVFAGTWFSTFSGYIIRLRGYYGMSKYFSYYSWLDRKFFMHRWMDIWEGSLYAREYPTGWTGIDGDVFVDNDNEGSRDSGPFPREQMELLKAKNTATLIESRYHRHVGGTQKDKASSANHA